MRAIVEEFPRQPEVLSQVPHPAFMRPERRNDPEGTCAEVQRSTSFVGRGAPRGEERENNREDDEGPSCPSRGAWR